MPQANPLFTAADLAGWLHEPVAEADAEVDERVVWGWLQPLLGLTERPSPTGDQLFAWAVELGGIAHENPAGLSVKETGPFREQYSAERRAEILAEVVSGGMRPPGAPPAPVGSFPAARAYPDAAERC